MNVNHELTVDENTCDERLFSQLFKDHATDLYKFLYYKYGANNNPQDLVQEAFAKLWKNCKKVTRDKARGFLFTVANNQMLNELDKQKTKLNYNLASKPSQITNESPEFLLEEKEYMLRLQKAIEELSEDHRVTFLLNRIEGKKHAEIAEILGVSKKAVEKRIYTALAQIMKKVGKI